MMTTPVICSQNWYVQMHSTALISDWITSMHPSIVSVLISSVYVLHRRVCCRHSWSHLAHCVNMRTRVNCSSVWHCSRKRRPCLSELFTITSTSRIRSEEHTSELQSP